MHPAISRIFEGWKIRHILEFVFPPCQNEKRKVLMVAHAQHYKGTSVSRIWGFVLQKQSWWWKWTSWINFTDGSNWLFCPRPYCERHTVRLLGWSITAIIQEDKWNYFICNITNTFISYIYLTRISKQKRYIDPCELHRIQLWHGSLLKVIKLAKHLYMGPTLLLFLIMQLHFLPSSGPLWSQAPAYPDLDSVLEVWRP